MNKSKIYDYKNESIHIISYKNGLKGTTSHLKVTNLYLCKDTRLGCSRIYLTTLADCDWFEVGIHGNKGAGCIKSNSLD